MLDLPVEYITAIGAMAAALGFVVRQYIADLKESNTYLRDSLSKTAIAQQEVLEQMNRKLENLQDEIGRVRGRDVRDGH